ncbi:MAG: hypothetical protein KDB65_01550 [Calditrichaeota bacterium]|nr:hypothetical protein [Calditrichota bacterium]MCB9369094.1 hypothetical protein [Calditrichota bacterium]
MEQQSRKNFVELQFYAREGKEETPHLALYLIEQGGSPRKISKIENDKFVADPKWEKTPGATIGIGPDVEDLSTLNSETLIKYRVADVFAEWRRGTVLQLAPEWWRGWLFPLRCVSGRVRKCLPILGPVLPNLGIPYLPHFVERCWPICNGVVEVYERTCCCHWLHINIKDLLRRIHEELIPIPIPDPDPGPLHLPGVGPDPSPISFVGRLSFGDEIAFNPQPEPPAFYEDRVAQRAFKRLESAGLDEINLDMQAKLREDVRALQTLAQADVEKFVELRPYLWHLICHCSSHKLGEAVLRPDGSFTYCWRTFPLYTLAHCYRSYYYKVRQWQDGQWVYVYDGSSRHEYFKQSDFADLKTFLGRTCGQDDSDFDNDRPFVMLQEIGGTSSSVLNSHWLGKNLANMDLTQTSENNLANLPTTGGLAQTFGGASNCPWAKSLALRLLFHPDMKALGAHYYRISTVRAGDNGDPLPGETPTPLSQPLAWSKMEFLGGSWEVTTEGLGPDSKVVAGNTVNGLYKIPYYTDGIWLGGQYHGYWNTGSSNDKYLLYVEVFDVNGNRLMPNTAGFDFLRRLAISGPGSTAKVQFGKLAHVFWVDNRPVYADIEDLRKNGHASGDECQFMTGPASTKFSVGFRAFHRTVNSLVAPITFMRYYSLDWHRGLNGPTVTFQTGNSNAPTSLDAGNSQQSTELAFSTMLGKNTIGAKCTFAVNLWCYAKHTNGSRFIYEYDRRDQAAFALEITT